MRRCLGTMLSTRSAAVKDIIVQEVMPKSSESLEVRNSMIICPNEASE